jgi:hypothetical protein
VGFTISGESRGLFAVMDETPDDVRLGGIRQAVLLLERSHPSAPPVDAASKESCRNGIEEQEEVKKTVDRQVSTSLIQHYQFCYINGQSSINGLNCNGCLICTNYYSNHAKFILFENTSKLYVRIRFVLHQWISKMAI